MPPAVLAQHLGSDHAMAVIHGFIQGSLLVDRLIEAGPSASAVVFGLRAEQRLAAPGTTVNTFCEMVIVFVVKRHLSALLPQYAISLFIQYGLPLFLRPGLFSAILLPSFELILTLLPPGITNGCRH